MRQEFNAERAFNTGIGSETEAELGSALFRFRFSRAFSRGGKTSLFLTVWSGRCSDRGKSWRRVEGARTDHPVFSGALVVHDSRLNSSVPASPHGSQNQFVALAPLTIPSCSLKERKA